MNGKEPRALAGEAGLASATVAESCVTKLARFFPEALPARIPVRVTVLRTGGRALSESAVLEYGTQHEVLFLSGLPLEFDDRVRLRNSDGSLDVEAVVIAVEYHANGRAVAARFLTEVSNWIIQR